MTFKRFHHFLEQKGKAHKWSMPEKTEPQMPEKGKFLKPDEYYSPGAKKDMGLVTADDDRGTPFGDRSSPGMADHKKVHPYGEKPAPAPKKLPKHGGKVKKMKTEAFINQTAELSDPQFTNMMIENNKVRQVKLTDLGGNKFVPEPAETMGYVAKLMTTNENIMGRMVREIKRRGGMESLISEIFSHPESFQIVEKAASKDARINRKLLEAVAEPRGMSGGSAGGSGIGPSGATAGGPLTNRKVNPGGGGGMPMTPPGPPGLGEDETEGEGEGDLLDGDLDMGDDDPEDGDDLDLDGDDEGDFLGGDEDEDLEDDSIEDEEDDGDLDLEKLSKKHKHHDDDEHMPPKMKGRHSGAMSGSHLGGGETGGGIGSGQLTL